MLLPIADIAIGACAIAFAFMGLVAIVTPKRVTQQFDIPVLTVAGRNEVRAVYGGFGIAMSIILVGALFADPLRTGICFSVGGALAGMACGRALSAMIDRSIGAYPRLYLCIEACGAALLFYAA
jgi:hypothetical protein